MSLCITAMVLHPTSLTTSDLSSIDITYASILHPGRNHPSLRPRSAPVVYIGAVRLVQWKQWGVEWGGGERMPYQAGGEPSLA